MPKKTKQDPTGQAANRRAAKRRLFVRIARVASEVKALFNGIPRTVKRETVITNAIIPVYDYQITPAELEELLISIRQVVNSGMEVEADRMPPNWWWQDSAELPYRQGMVEGVVEFNQLITSEIVRIRSERGLVTQRPEIGHVLQSDQYRNALNHVYVRNFNEIKTLSTRTADQVVGEINRGIASKTPPTKIVAGVIERFEVAKSSASRIVDTEINRAYNDARLEATDIAAEQTGLRAAVLHLSALLPTTRDEHGARHGNAYTTNQQRQWWDSGSNRIRCHCSTRSVLVDRQGRVIDVELQEEVQAEREFFNLAPQVPPPPAKPAISRPKSTTEVVKSIKKAKASEGIQSVRRSKKGVKARDQKIRESDSPPKLRKPRLTGDEAAYVEYYKGDGFYKSNEILRNPAAFTQAEVESAAKMRDSINSAISKSEIIEGGSLYRGIRSPGVFDNAEGLIGKTIPISTPQSTASNAGASLGWAGVFKTSKGGFVSADRGQSVIFKINVKKGQHALDLESLSMGNTGEKEVLLASGGVYRVKKVRHLTDDNGVTTAKIIEVDYDE